jgi:arylsulfatase A-like enzyme
LRAILLSEKGLGLRWVDVRGFVADASVALLVVVLLGSLLRWPCRFSRVLVWVLGSLFVAATFGVYEVVSAFDSLHAIGYARLLADPTFLGGSVRHMAHLGLFVASLGLLLVASVFAQAPQQGRWQGWVLGIAGFTLVQLAIPISHRYDEWRQSHAIHALVSTIRTAPVGRAGKMAREVGQVFSADLDGRRWIDPLSDRPNLILVLLEAVSAPVLPSVASEHGVDAAVAMPKLDARAEEHLLFTQVIAHQRQTNRGEYGILCGDYPKLLSDQSKMTEQVYGRARRCLPDALRELGYHTAYLQAAPLAFMLKDQFMPRAGFAEVLGGPSWSQSYGRTDWGVDDKAFFEQALPRLKALHEEAAPFFATLLTVGTHHPFTLPWVPGERSGERRMRAFRWLDDAVDAFVEALEREGILEDTAVIITSDESGGWLDGDDPTLRLLSQSWSFALVILPGQEVARVNTLLAHSDLALTVLDLLGRSNASQGFIGRSWFREYEAPRPMFAGNTYGRRVVMWKPEGNAVICDEGFRSCLEVETGEGRAFVPKSSGHDALPRDARLLAEVARLTRSGRTDLSTAGPMSLMSSDRVGLRASEGKKILAGGQYLRVPADTRVRVDFDLEVQGQGAVIRFHQDVFLEGYERFARKRVWVREGERWQLRYEVPVRKSASQLVVQLYAEALSGEDSTILVRQATVELLESAGQADDTVVTEDRLTAASSH